MPQGGTAGSARTRSRVQTLENPFLGNDVRFPPVARPPTAAGGKPLLVGLPPSTPAPRPNRTETQNTHPLLVGWVFVYTAPKALAAGTAG